MARHKRHGAKTTGTPVSTSSANTQKYVSAPPYRVKNFNDYVPFDTLPIVGNQQQYAFFTQGIGSNGKTQFDTNMTTGSQFPLGRDVVIKGIGFHLIFSNSDSPGTTNPEQVQALYTLMEGGYFELVIQGRQFEFQAPGSLWLPEIAMSQISNNITPTLASTYDRVGDYFKQGGYVLRQPITLQNLVPWQLNFNVNLQDPGVQAAIGILTPGGFMPARLRMQLLANLRQGT